MNSLKDKAKGFLGRRIFFCVAFGFFLLCGMLLVLARKTVSFRLCAILAILIYLLFVLSLILFDRFSRRGPSHNRIDPILGNSNAELMQSFHMPIVISDENDKVIWFNDAFRDVAGGKRNFLGKSVEQILSHPVQEILSCTEPAGLPVYAFDRYFDVKGYRVTGNGGKTGCVTVWQDVSELNDLLRHLEEKEPTVAYLMIDNIEEVGQDLQDRYRSAAAEVSLVLRDWARSVGGILREYDKDKFIFLFETAGLDRFVAEQFDILDRVRNIRVGDNCLPVTVSIGVSRIDGSLEEKERAAHIALDMALQRGGDQVVLKTEENMEFYGGRTKTVQKRTKVRARVIANQLVTLMAESDNILVMGHKYPDFDCVAACVGVARLALFCGVDVHIILDEKDPNIERGIKKLKRSSEYTDLFVSASEAQDMIRPDTLLVIADVNNKKQYESSDVAKSVDRIVVIDHHRKTAEFETEPLISYIEPSASSASELISEILEQTLPSGTIAKDEADLLLAGMLLDTKQFSKNTGVRTFSAALFLRNEGAAPSDAQALFRGNLEDLTREARIESNVTIYREHIAIATNENETGETDGTPADRTAAAKAADKLLNIDGVYASFVLCEIGNTIHISARSSEKINVQILLEKLNGGGHFDSAATKLINTKLHDALDLLKKTIDEYLDNMEEIR